MFASKFVFIQKYFNTPLCKVMEKIWLDWYMAVLSIHERMRQGDYSEFKARLGNIVRPI